MYVPIRVYPFYSANVHIIRYTATVHTYVQDNKKTGSELYWNPAVCSNTTCVVLQVPIYSDIITVLGLSEHGTGNLVLGRTGATQSITPPVWYRRYCDICTCTDHLVLSGTRAKSAAPPVGTSVIT